MLDLMAQTDGLPDSLCTDAAVSADAGALLHPRSVKPLAFTPLTDEEQVMNHITLLPPLTLLQFSILFKFSSQLTIYDDQKAYESNLMKEFNHNLAAYLPQPSVPHPFHARFSSMHIFILVSSYSGLLIYSLYCLYSSLLSVSYICCLSWCFYCSIYWSYDHDPHFCWAHLLY